MTISYYDTVSLLRGTEQEAWFDKLTMTDYEL